MRNLKEQNTNKRNPQGKGVKYLIDNRVVVDSNKSLQIPVGDNSQRPDDLKSGEIRYNTDLLAFEGNDGSNWRSLGGVTDVDRDTFIQSETSPGSDEDRLEFFTNNIKRASLDETGLTVESDLTLGNELSVPNGGTDRTQFTNNGVLYGNGTNELKETLEDDPGGNNVETSNGILTANSNGTPVWTDVIDGGTF